MLCKRGLAAGPWFSTTSTCSVWFDCWSYQAVSAGKFGIFKFGSSCDGLGVDASSGCFQNCSFQHLALTCHSSSSDLTSTFMQDKSRMVGGQVLVLQSPPQAEPTESGSFYNWGPWAVQTNLTSAATVCLKDLNPELKREECIRYNNRNMWSRGERLCLPADGRCVGRG